MVYQMTRTLPTAAPPLARWTSGTGGEVALRCEMQVDGNLVLKTTGGVPYWSSGTSGVGVAPYELVMQVGAAAGFCTGG